MRTVTPRYQVGRYLKWFAVYDNYGCPWKALAQFVGGGKMATYALVRASEWARMMNREAE